MSKAGGISLHAVDVSTGKPAHGLSVRLLRLTNDGSELVASELVATGVCGQNGALDHPCVTGKGIIAGCYVAEFEVGAYYEAKSLVSAKPAFLDVVQFHFGIADCSQHFHLPFKFTAWGYSLFRGGL